MDRKDLQRMREFIVSFPGRYSHEDGRLTLRETVGFCMFSQKPANDTAEFYQAVDRLGRRHTLMAEAPLDVGQVEELPPGWRRS